MTLQARLDQWLIENDKVEKSKRKSGVISPSSLGQCYRRQYWTRKGEQISNPTPVEVMRVFQAGKVFHEFLQRYYDKGQVEVEVQSPEGDVYGHADIVTDDEVIDIKSVGTFAWKVFSKDGFNLADDKIEHCLQVMTYAYYLYKGKGRMVYVNKDTLEIKEYELVMREWQRKVEEEILRLRRIWDNGELPPAQPRLYIQKDGTCKEGNYCQFAEKCWTIEGKKCTECKSSGKTFVF